MPKPTGRENPKVRKLIAALKKKKESFYSDIVRYISKPARTNVAVNLTKLSRFEDDIVVPGVVLGDGKISKASNVYALSFSKTAKEKIERAGGRCLPIERMLEGGKKARIVI